MGKREDDVLPGKQTVMKVLSGAAFGLLLTLLLLAAAAALVSGGTLPAESLMTLTCVVAAVSVFLASLMASRMYKGKRWLLGSAVGLCAFLILFLIGLLFSFPPSGVPQMMAATVAAGLLGGLLGGRRRKKR